MNVRLGLCKTSHSCLLREVRVLYIAPVLSLSSNISIALALLYRWIPSADRSCPTSIQHGCHGAIQYGRREVMKTHKSRLVLKHFAV